MQADISGSQRKTVEHSVRPAHLAHGAAGIALKDGKTLPFRVSRGWSAPAGEYAERFYIIDTKSREVLFEGPERTELVRGLQAVTEFQDEIAVPFELSPGTYGLIFAVGGMLGGEETVEAYEVVEEAA
jgi:hypothetical protein